MSSIYAIAPVSVFHHHGYTPTIILSHHITSHLSLCLPPTVLTNCSNNHYMWGATLLHFHGYTPIITHPPPYRWPLTIIIHLHHLPHIATVIVVHPMLTYPHLHNHHNQYHIFTSILSQLHHQSYNHSYVIPSHHQISLVLSPSYLHGYTFAILPLLLRCRLYNYSCHTHVTLPVIQTRLCPQSIPSHLCLYSIYTPTIIHSHHITSHLSSPLTLPSPYHHYVSHPLCSPTVATITMCGEQHCSLSRLHSHYHTHICTFTVLSFSSCCYPQ
jgi:hypothetical protein